MSGSLSLSPADVLRHALVDLGLATLPSDGGAWPASVSMELDSPDSAIAMYDTVGRQHGREMVGGERQESYGVMIRVRAMTHSTGYAKAQAIAIALDEYLTLRTVTIGAAEFTIYSVSRTSNVLSLGSESPVSSRQVFSVNAVVTLRQVS